MFYFLIKIKNVHTLITQTDAATLRHLVSWNQVFRIIPAAATLPEAEKCPTWGPKDVAGTLLQRFRYVKYCLGNVATTFFGISFEKGSSEKVVGETLRQPFLLLAILSNNSSENKIPKRCRNVSMISVGKMVLSERLWQRCGNLSIFYLKIRNLNCRKKWFFPFLGGVWRHEKPPLLPTEFGTFWTPPRFIGNAPAASHVVNDGENCGRWCPHTGVRGMHVRHARLAAGVNEASRGSITTLFFVTLPSNLCLDRDNIYSCILQVNAERATSSPRQ